MKSNEHGAPVKPRRYVSTRRREQAAETRARILESARVLFEERGYAATSVGAIAGEAGVALKTVYLAFETKAGVLRALWHLLLRGDESAVPVGEREWYREVLAESSPSRQLALNARNSRVVKERLGGLLDVLAAAAPSDPDVAELWQRIEREFYENQRAIARSLERKKALRPGLGVERAADLLWTLNHPSVYRLLVKARGWTPAQYESWLASTWASQLLADAE